MDTSAFHCWKTLSTAQDITTYHNHLEVVGRSETLNMGAKPIVDTTRSSLNLPKGGIFHDLPNIVRLWSAS